MTEIISQTRHLVVAFSFCQIPVSTKLYTSAYFPRLTPLLTFSYPKYMEHAGRHFPNTLRRHRKLWKYSQKEVSLLLGHKDSTRLSKWESGEALPGPLNLIKLGIIYHTIPTEFYFEYYSKTRNTIFKKMRDLKTKASLGSNLAETPNSGDNWEK